MKHFLSLAAGSKGHIALERCWPNESEPALMAINHGDRISAMRMRNSPQIRSRRAPIGAALTPASCNDALPLLTNAETDQRSVVGGLGSICERDGSRLG
jgi:hypothetical protein